MNVNPATAVVAGMLAYSHPRELGRSGNNVLSVNSHNTRYGSRAPGFLFVKCVFPQESCPKKDGPVAVNRKTRKYECGSFTDMPLAAVAEDAGSFPGNDATSLERGVQEPTRVTCADMSKAACSMASGGITDSEPGAIQQNTAASSGDLYKLFGWVRKIIPNRDKSAVYMELIDGTSPSYTPVIVRDTYRSYRTIENIDVGDAITAVGSLQCKAVGEGKQVSQVRIVVENEEAAHCITHHQTQRHQGIMPVTINGVCPIASLRDHCNLRARNSLIQAIFRIRSTVTENLFRILPEMGFIHVTTPSLTGMNCEGMGDIFKVVPDNMDEAQSGTETYLSVSGQLELEAMCSGFSRVWKLGPAFRADRSDTPRHLSEFWMLEAEINDVTLPELISHIETIIKRSADGILSQCGPDLEVLKLHLNEDVKRRLELLENAALRTISYSQAVDMLNKAKESDPTMEHGPVSHGDALTAAHERSLIRILQQPLIAVTNYPEVIMPFYMQRGENGSVNNVDLIADGVGEIAGGSLREVRYDLLKSKMEQKNISGADYEQYLELRKAGNAPHGGFGIGLERMLMYLLRLQNIRDVIHFPKLRKKYSVD